MASILKEWLIKSLLLEQRGGIWQVGAGGRRQERMGAVDQERLPRGRCGFRRMNKSLKIGWWRGGHSGHRDWHLRMSFVIYPASSVPVTTAPCTAAHGPLGLLSLFTAAETWSVSSGQGHRGCLDGSAHQGRVQLSPLIFHKCRFWRPQGGVGGAWAERMARRHRVWIQTPLRKGTRRLTGVMNMFIIVTGDGFMGIHIHRLIRPRT